jgi:hypothetical protein
VRARSFSLFLVSLLVVNALGIELSANGQPLPTFQEWSCTTPVELWETGGEMECGSRRSSPR